MDATTVAVDVAKDVFEVALANRAGRVIGRRRLTRRQFGIFLETLAPAVEVVMETGSTAHYWGRRCQARGLTVFLVPAQYVRPYVRRNKTDRSDAEALLEARRCGGIHPVPVKSVEQQSLQALHRIRAQWQTARTARINVMRGVLREHGVFIGAGARTAVQTVHSVVSDPAVALPDVVRQALALLLEEVRQLAASVHTIDVQLARLVRQHPIARRLHEIPGVGVLTASALVGAVGDIQAFRRGRQFASWLGLTPREYSSGSRRWLGGISKRGDAYLRCLLTHGARAVVQSATRAVQRTPDRVTRLQQWAVTVALRGGRNKAISAVANKLARIVWVVWSRGIDFVDDPREQPA